MLAWKDREIAAARQSVAVCGTPPSSRPSHFIKCEGRPCHTMNECGSLLDPNLTFYKMRDLGLAKRDCFGKRIL